MKVYQAINAVSAELAREGIGKGGKNQQQGYAFRGIDQVMNTLAPVLARHKLVIFPRIISRECEARTTRSGGVLYSVSVLAEFDFVSAEDGSKHTACMPGEGMDSADKATNKAVAAAYKYVVCQTFCIPLEGSADADAVTPEDTIPMQKENPRSAPVEEVFAVAADEEFPASSKGAEVHPLKTPWLAKKAESPKVQHPTARDSGAVRKLLMFALENCETREHALAFSQNNGQKSEKWPLLTKADQDAVLKAVKAKFAAIAAKDKPKSAANA